MADSYRLPLTNGSFHARLKNFATSDIVHKAEGYGGVLAGPISIEQLTGFFLRSACLRQF